MVKKQALGRGLGALIDDAEREKLEEKVEANLEINIDDIGLNPFSHEQGLMNSYLKSWLLQSVNWELYSLLRSGKREITNTSLLPVNDD